MAREITNSEDVIDSRDVIERIAELEDELENPGLDQEDREAELAALKELAEQGSDAAPDWQHGETLIRDSYFKDYAMQLADDIGAIDANARWPLTCIDWDQAARELQVDYTPVEFDGITYWIR